MDDPSFKIPEYATAELTCLWITWAGVLQTSIIGGSRLTAVVSRVS